MADSDGARKALEVAQRRQASGDDDAARRFIDKALRLDPILAQDDDASALKAWLDK